MALPTSITIPTTQGVLLIVPANQRYVISTIHVGNESGVARTVSLFAKATFGPARPISPVAMALDVGGLAVHTVPLMLEAGTSLEGVASGSGVSCFITGTVEDA